MLKQGATARIREEGLTNDADRFVEYVLQALPCQSGAFKVLLRHTITVSIPRRVLEGGSMYL
jgi:hypothetical protein